MDPISPSSHSGMGAITYGEGTSFRVWAPHAEQAFVTGTFNGWSKTANPLANEGNGYWSTDVSGVRAGDEYKFIINSQSKELMRIDPYAREVTSSAGNAVVHDPHFDWGDGEYRPPPVDEMVIYEMHLGTFNDQPGGPPGNLGSAMEKLPYLLDLGINVIELMPAMEFAGGFSWGYNPSHIFAVESDYGGPKALKEFVKEAQSHGIAVIIDVVYNHFGPGDLDIWQFDGWSEDDKGGIYFYNDRRCRTPWGDTRPDYAREEVRQYIRDNVMMMLEEYRMDGLRWDMTAFIRNVHGKDGDPGNDIPEGWALMQWINDEKTAAQPWRIGIAEDLQNNASITIAKGEGGAGFDAQWDAGFVHPLREALISAVNQVCDMDAVKGAVSHRYPDDAFKRVIYTESHDEVANGKARVPEEISPGDAGSWIAKKLSTLGAALVFTSPGIPMIFQGQEFLEDEWFHDQDPIDWSKKEKYGGILHLYRDLIRLRRNCDGKTRGLCGQQLQIHHINKEARIIAYHRWDQGGPGDSVMVIVNMGNQMHEGYQIGFPRDGQWNVRFNSDWDGYDPDFGNYPSLDVAASQDEKDEMPFAGAIDVGPYSVIIMSQDS